MGVPGTHKLERKFRNEIDLLATSTEIDHEILEAMESLERWRFRFEQFWGGYPVFDGHARALLDLKRLQMARTAGGW